MIPVIDRNNNIAQCFDRQMYKIRLLYIKRDKIVCFNNGECPLRL